VGNDMFLNAALIVFLSGAAASIGTVIGAYLHKRMAKRDCSDCTAMNAVLEAITILVQYSTEIPSEEKARLQIRLTVPGK
jgi:hypothetical protein